MTTNYCVLLDAYCVSGFLIFLSRRHWAIANISFPVTYNFTNIYCADCRFLSSANAY